MARGVVQAALLVLLLAACGGEPPAPTVDQRLIVLGFDGMDPNLATRWMDAGKLPNFRRLAEQGTFRPLGTSNPPQSPVAWSSFATGLNPGHHGIYDFLRRDADSYAPAFSISEVRPPETVLKLFGAELPLDDPEIVNRRQGEPFWLTHENGGGRSTVLRVPVTYPASPIHRMLSGMGVPDLLGTQGTYTLFTTRPMSSVETGSRIVRLRAGPDGSATTTIEGPPHPLSGEPMGVEMTVAPVQDGVRIGIGDQVASLQTDHWSDWITLEFDFLGAFSVPGVVRFRLLEDYPRPRIYMSPIQIDPRDPAVPLSSPPEYAQHLAERIGLYHTIGMPEETWSLNAGHLTDAAFLDMERTILAEREAMFFDALGRRDSELVVGVFVQTDRISHMFYRGLDPEHPLHAETDQTARGAIEWIYTEADRILGQTLEQMQPGDRLIVMSDHGFAPFRRSVHLNRWLADEGFLALKEGADSSDIGFADVDWTRTRAYAAGLNGLFLNLQGREAQGALPPDQAEQVLDALEERLSLWVDEENGQAVVARVFRGAEIYEGNANDDAPDIVVGYDRGYRASWQTTLGAVPRTLIEDNRGKWSGDHCMAPELVPGVLFADFQLPDSVQSIEDLAGLILEELQ